MIYHCINRETPKNALKTEMNMNMNILKNNPLTWSWISWKERHLHETLRRGFHPLSVLKATKYTTQTHYLKTRTESGARHQEDAVVISVSDRRLCGRLTYIIKASVVPSGRMYGMCVPRDESGLFLHLSPRDLDTLDRSSSSSTFHAGVVG